MHVLTVPQYNSCRLASGPRPQVISPELVPVRRTSPRRTDNLLGFVRSADTSTPPKHTSLASMCLVIYFIKLILLPVFLARYDLIMKYIILFNDCLSLDLTSSPNIITFLYKQMNKKFPLLSFFPTILPFLFVC